MSELLEGLNDPQRQAVTHEGGPLLIVAGAGTGKTTVLARRYAWLIREKQLSTEQIVALTFTEKAAQEMEDRVLQLLPNGTYDFWISTFHGFCQRILEEHGLDIGLPHHFRLLNETDAWLLLKRRIHDLPLDYYRPLGNPVKFLSALLTHFSRAKDEGVSPERYLAFARDAILDGDSEIVEGERKRLQELADCYAAYRRILREEGCLDFGDLIVETLRLLRERPAVLKEYRERFRFFMVDEFQDTNWAQYELVKLLTDPERNITVVGDDDQSIYKFRGASLANILQFRDDYPDAKTVALTTNYRSKQEILDAAGGFIRKNDPNRLEVTLAAMGLSKKLEAAKGGGGTVEAKWYRSIDEEADKVAMAIANIKTVDAETTWNDFAILVRSNDGAAPFLHALERHDVPYRFYALRGLYSKPAVLDLIALLRIADRMHDSAIVWRVINLPTFQFSVPDTAAFLAYANRKGIPLWHALREARFIPGIQEETVKRADGCVAKIDALAETAKREVPQRVLQHVLEKTGYLAYLLSQPEAEKIEAIGFLNAFVDRIKRYEASTHGPSLHGFLEELTLEIDSGNEGGLDADPDAGPELVKIMTVHASKGLEFKHVFVVSMVDQRFPTRERGDAIPLPDGLVNERLPMGDAHIEEERRLLYVAMTRAKETLTLTGASHYGGSRAKKPSVFLGEAGLQTEVATVGLDEVLRVPARDVTPKEMAEREHFPLKRRFSFTQLAAFRSCPLQYKFAHVYRIPIIGSFHKSFGQSIHLTFHDVLQLHMERGKATQGSLFEAASLPVAAGFRVALEEALEIYEDRWIDEWYPDRKRHDEYKAEGREAVKRMWEVWSEHPPEIKALEYGFEWRIGDRSLKGSVDRIDLLPDGGCAIYDYKTGEPKTTEDLERSDKEQLYIYQLAMEERGLDIRKLAYVYVRTGQEANVPLLQGNNRAAFKNDIEERMNEILSSTFPPQPSPYICRYCDFRHVCEYRKL